MQLQLNILPTVRDRNDENELRQRLAAAEALDRQYNGESTLIAHDVKTLRDEIEHLGRTHPSIW